MRIFPTALILVLASAAAFPQYDVKQAIRSAYDLSYKAAAFKYAYGMMSYRSEDFAGIDANGQELNTDNEKVFYTNLLRQALTVEETGKILSFQELADGTVRCEVLDTFTADVVIDARTQAKVRWVITTHSIDRWKRTDKGWRMFHQQVLDQHRTQTPLQTSK